MGPAENKNSTAIKVQVSLDHLQRIAARRSPIQAVAELIWNALDADATEVSVEIFENDLGAIKKIRVADNGGGIPSRLANEAFKSLGASWKKGKRSAEGRCLHGQAGEGRFSVYSLGSRARWNTRYRTDSGIVAYQILGTDSELDTFTVGTPTYLPSGSPGTEVEIDEMTSEPRSLIADDADFKLTKIFAPYLLQYPAISINYNGKSLDPSQVQDRVTDYTLAPFVSDDGRTFEVKLTVIEWKHRQDRELMLCDSDGFSLHVTNPGIKARGFTFSAYLKTAYMRELDNQNLLVLEDMNSDCIKLIEAAKDRLRSHFRVRAAEDAMSVVQKWKADEIYPYEDPPSSEIETIERQLFDIVALNVHEYLPEFGSYDLRSKKFSLYMLKAALEKSPWDVQKVIMQILELPREKQEELTEIIEKTSLDAMINASKLVVDRLDFLAGLEVILFDYEMKKKLKERQHLHRIIAENTWIFGEEFFIAVDDQSLSVVLKKHEKLLGREPANELPVTTIDGKTGIIDLMVSRRIPQPRKDQIEHLVIELKRPSKSIDSEVTNQIKKYAFAVANDERFRGTNVRWIFWAVSNDMDEFTTLETSNQKNRPDGLLYEGDGFNMTIWTKTWGQIIEDCRTRLRLFQEGLNNYVATQDVGVSHLQNLYSKYLPTEFNNK